MKLRNIFINSVLFISFLLIGCGEKMALPSVEYSPESFGANDTSYIHLTPDWDADFIGSENDFNPIDIAIGLEGYLFVADSVNNKIFVLNEAGNIVKINDLDNIPAVNGPVGLAIDAKQHLLMVNNTNKIYVWNQYIHYVGVDSILVFSQEYPNGKYEANESKIDSVLGICVFYEDEDPTAQFNSITFGSKEDNIVYVTDKTNNRIIALELAYSSAVKLANGFEHGLFNGVYTETIAEEGSGAGTVDSPTSIMCDDEGNIYFTQLGGNFFVQKLDADNYSSQYTLYEHPIMDLERFKGPFGLALDEDNDIYVLDTADSSRVTKFVNHGVLAGDEADLGREGLSQARFNDARSIAISESNVIYIANTGAKRIDRYRYTIIEEEAENARD